MDERLNGTPLILRAVDLVIVDVERRDGSADREEELTLLHQLRDALMKDDSGES